MKSIRHTVDSSPVETDALLDAARDCLLAVGWRRTTMTDVARSASVSRMTLYRRWTDMDHLLGDLMTREWTRMVERVLERDDPDLDAPERIAAAVAGMVRGLRSDRLFGRILDVDPELLLPYLLDRRGRSQDLVLDLLAERIRQGQAAGQVRLADAQLLARSVLLTAHGFALSARTMTQPRRVSLAALDDELRRLVAAHLAPEAPRS